MKSLLRKTLATCTLLLLTSCATWQQLDDSLEPLVGQPLSVAIERLGFPSEEQTIAGLHLVRWNNIQTGLATIPQSPFSGPRVMGPGRIYLPGFNGNDETIPYSYSCLITVAVDDKNIIQRYEYDGNLSACRKYIPLVPEGTGFASED